MISRWLLTSCLLCTQLLTAQSTTGIQGIFLTGQKEDIVPEGRPAMTGVQTMDIEIPGGDAALKEILRPYLGKKVTRQNVIEIKQKIMTYYTKQGVTMLGVELPNQKTKGGVVQFLVSRKTFGKPIFTGESWYSDEKLSKYLGVTPNQEISEDVLQNNISWLNKNPFQYTAMKFVPGDEPDVLDIQFQSKHRRALRFYQRADDTGSNSTGYGRFATGFAWGNAFWVGDLLSFEWLYSNEFKRVQSYTGNYTSFLPWKHFVTVLASHVIVKPEGGLNQSITAKATQVRPRYTIPFKPLYTPLQQSVTVGFDYKNSNSSIINLSGSSAEVQPTLLPPVLNEIDVTQLVASYTMFNKLGNHSLSLNIGFTASPFHFLPHQTDEDYNDQRRNSQTQYYYFNLLLADVITIPKIMTISLLGRAQLANRTLPSTELFSMGGYNTVRGYHEVEAAGDNGFIGNLEIRSPSFSLFKSIKDQLLFLAFADFGVSNNWIVYQSVRPGAKSIPHTQYLLGVGPGLRYSINPYLQVRLDYGFKLLQLKIINPSQNKLLLGFGQFHVGVLASF